MWRPSPLPFLLYSRLNFSLDLKNGVKSSLRSCSEIPIPVSRTVMFSWTSFELGERFSMLAVTRMTSLGLENLRALVSKLMITYWVRIISISTIYSTGIGTNRIAIFCSSACCCKISTTFFIVKLKGCSAKLSWKTLRSSMFRSSKSLTWDSRSWLVDRISSSCLRYFKSAVYLRTLWVNWMMQRRGVIISCVTLDVRRVRILLFSEIFWNFLRSDMSRTLTKVHSLF